MSVVESVLKMDLQYERPVILSLYAAIFVLANCPNHSIAHKEHQKQLFFFKSAQEIPQKFPGLQ